MVQIGARGIAALIFVALLWADLTHACGNGDGSGVNTAEVVSLYGRFKSCRGLAGRDTISCVSSLTTSDTSERLNQKIARWLMDLDSLGSLENCPHEIVRLFPRANESRYVAIRCVSYEASGRADRALFYFAKEGGELKIAGIQKVRL